MKVVLLFIVIAGVYLLASAKSEKQDAANNAAIEKDDGYDKAENPCECAVFDTESPKADAEPLISRTLIYLPCDESGQKQCQELCLHMARAGRERAGQTLCETVEHAVKLKLSVFSKVCNEPTYFFNGLTSNKTYCCLQNEPVQCEDAEG